MMKKAILADLPERIETSSLCLHMPKAGFGPRLHEAILHGYEDYVKWLGWSSARPSVEPGTLIWNSFIIES